MTSGLGDAPRPLRDGERRDGPGLRRCGFAVLTQAMANELLLVETPAKNFFSEAGSARRRGGAARGRSRDLRRPGCGSPLLGRRPVGLAEGRAEWRSPPDIARAPARLRVPRRRALRAPTGSARYRRALCSSTC